MIKIKSKLIKKPAAEPIKKKKSISAKALMDLIRAKGYRVEWFDDRFYKIFIPLNINPDLIKNIPDNFKEWTGEEIEIFLPSVTTINNATESKPYLGKWRGEVGNKRADEIITEALDRGSNIHNAIDAYVNGTDIIFQNPKTMNITDDEIKQYKKKRKRPVLIIKKQDEMIQLARFQNLIQYIKPKILSSEETIFSLEECYAGTLDQTWYVEGGIYEINSNRTKQELRSGIYIVDFKTGKGYDEQSTYIQLAAYLQAHNLKDKIVGALGIHLNADTKSGIEGVKIHIRYKEDLINYYEQFLLYKKIFFFNNPIFPKKYEFPQILSIKRKITKTKGAEV